MAYEPSMDDISIEFITPEDAKAYLLMNENNRYLKERKTEAFMRDMQDGAWLWNGETIKFDREMKLIDGQNRLTAVIKAGVGQWFLVVYNVERAAQATIDTGAARTFSDTLKMMNYASDAPMIAGATRMVWVWEKGERNFRSAKSTPSIGELLVVLDNNRGLLDHTKAARNLSHKTVLTPSIALFLYYVLSNIDEADTKHFFEKLVSLADLPEDSPILQLHKSLERLSIRAHGNAGYLADYQVALTVKAWNKYRKGIPSSLIKFNPGGSNPEQFPEPV